MCVVTALLVQVNKIMQIEKITVGNNFNFLFEIDTNTQIIRWICCIKNINIMLTILITHLMYEPFSTFENPNRQTINLGNTSPLVSSIRHVEISSMKVDASELKFTSK